MDDEWPDADNNGTIGLIDAFVWRSKNVSDYWPNSYSEGAYRRSLTSQPHATSEPQQSPGGALSEVSRTDSADVVQSKAVAAHETRRAPCCDSQCCLGEG